MALYTVFQAATYFVHLISVCIFGYCLLTWVAPQSSLRYWLERFVAPFCAPFRKLSQKIMMRWGARIDLSCWFAMIALEIVGNLLWRLYDLLYMLIY